MKLPDAMHAGQERSVRRGRGLAAKAAPVVGMLHAAWLYVGSKQKHFAKSSRNCSAFYFTRITTSKTTVHMF